MIGIIVAISIVVVALVVYIFTQQKKSIILTQRIVQYDAICEGYEESQANLTKLQGEVVRYGVELSSVNSAKELLQNENIQLKSNEREFTALNSKLKAESDFLNEKLNTQREEIASLRKQMTVEFENIANRLLEQKSEKFTTVNRESIDKILAPLGQSIKEFKNSVEEKFTEETKQRSSIQEHVRNLIEQTNKVSLEANNLASALKGKSKTRGNWGEMILESVLQQSGMEQGREYDVQVTLRDEDGRILRPDVIINLPNNRSLIVDSKVSLVAYDKYCSSSDQSEQDVAIKSHVASMKLHIDDLSRKKYDSLPSAPDFTMMFIPIEPAYMIGIQADPDMWNYAYSKGIMLVSPSSLLPCCKLITNMWYKDRENKTAQDIINRGELIYQKLLSFVTSLDKVGESLNSAQKRYDESRKQLVDGKGNFFTQADELRRLSSKMNKRTAKELPDWSDIREV